MPPTPVAETRGHGSLRGRGHRNHDTSFRSSFPIILSLWLKASWAETGRSCPLLPGAWSRRSAMAQGPVRGSAAASERKAAAKPMPRPRRAITITQALVLDASQERKAHRARTPQRKTWAVGSLTTHERQRVVTLMTGAFSLPDLLKLPGGIVVTSLS